MILTLALATVLTSVTAPHAERDKFTTVVPPPWKHTLGLNRVNQRHLDIYSGYRKKFDEPEGIAAVKLRFNDAEGRGDDDELTVLGVNSGTGEIFYNKSMVSLGFFGRERKSEQILRDPVGIAADEWGRVIVSDRGNDRLVRLRMSDNNELEFVDTFDLAESGMATRAPSGVAIEGENVYIADSGNNRIAVADLEGRYVRDIDCDQRPIEPFGIAAVASNRWNYFRSRFLVVSDSLRQRLSMFSLEGDVIRSVRYAEVSDARGGFDFLAIDYYSNVYVSDAAGGCVFKFDRNLKYLTRVGCGTDSGADLHEPRGIAIYRRFGQIFVAERSGASYFWTGTDVRNLRCELIRVGSGYRLDARFLLTERATVDVRLESTDGKNTKTLIDDAVVDPGAIELAWPVGAGELPCPLANCKYQLRVRARPTYSSREYLRVERRAPVRIR